MLGAEVAKQRATFITRTSRASALLDVVREFAIELERLAAAHVEIDRARRERMAEAVREIRRRLNRDDLWVAIVGEFNAGKSTFLNAVLGARVLGTSVREFTGVVTVLRHGDEPDYVYESDAGRPVRFADEVPDQRPALRQVVASAEVATASAQQQVASARWARDEAFGRAQSASAALDDIRARELAYYGQVEAANHVAAQRCTQSALAAREEVRAAGLVPSFVRAAPRWWALWLWIARAFVGWIWARRKADWLAASQTRMVSERGRVEAEEGLVAWTTSAEHTSRARGASEFALRDATVALAAADAAVTAAEGALSRAAASVERARGDLARHEALRLTRFLENVQQLAAIDRPGGVVRSATIRYPSPLLAQGLVLLDTPGLNTPQKQYEDRSWAAIERDADACILLTPAGQAMGKSTREALRRMCQYVPHVALAITKADKVEEDIFSDDPEEVRAQVNEALQESVRRFAQDMGRAPSDVVWIATAAERATPGATRFDPLRAKDFEASLARLTRVLAGERVAVLGVRAARIGEEVVREVRAEVARLEGLYNERIRQLEAGRLPDPEAEVERITHAYLPLLEAAVEGNTPGASEALDAIATDWLAEVQVEIQGAADKGALERFAKSGLANRIQTLSTRCQQTLDAFLSACTLAVNAEVRAAAEQVHERYRIAAGLSQGEVSLPALQLDLGPLQALGAASVAASLSEHGEQELFAGGVGAGAGAAIGTLLLPGIGTVVGGVLGGVAGWLFSPSLDELKGKVGEGCASVAQHATRDAQERLQNLRHSICAAAAEGLREVLAGEVHKYNAWIERVLAAEQRRIAEERAKVRDLLERAGRVYARTSAMTKGVAEVARESSMMARAGASTEGKGQ